MFVGLDDQPDWLRWGVSIGVATASWWLWERPFLRLKRRFGRDPIDGATASD